MPDRSRKPKRPADPNEMAAQIVQEATGGVQKKGEKNPAAVALGRLGGLRGGKARAKKLSADRRREIARAAAAARWKKRVVKAK